MLNRLLRFAPVLLGVAVISGCTSANPVAALNPPAADQQTVIDAASNSAVVQGACPQVLMREGTAFYRTYAKGGDGDPGKVIHQASFSDTTRQCRLSGDQMTVTVVASGRVVSGPLGKPGEVNVPVRVAVVDGDTVLYSELQKQPVVLAAGTPATQFIFTNANVTFPASAARSAKVYIGFDPGPYNTP